MSPILPNTPPDSRVWRVIHYPPVLLVIGFLMVAFSAALVWPFGTRGPLSLTGTPAGTLLVAVLVAAAAVAAYWLFVRLVERRAAVDEFARVDAIRELGAGLIAGVVLFSVVIAIIAALGGYRITGWNRATVLLPWLGIAITSGVTEEILFRGVFFRLIERWLGSAIALAASAILFGAAHLDNPNATWFAGLAIAFEAGVMLAALYMLTRRLWAAMGLHAAWNFAQGGLYGVPVSGFHNDGLARTRIAGPDLLTGGAFGAEASLVALIVCTVFGVALLFACAKHDRFVPPPWKRI